MTDKAIFLKTYQKAVASIENEITDSSRYLATTFPVGDPFHDEIGRFIVQGGKRFRPALSLIIAESFGKRDVFPHLALETFHKYLLAHDDIIDKDTMRYGASTLHVKMAEQLQNNPDESHFGTSLAIIAGDLIEAATHKIILNADLSADTKINLQKLIIQAMEDVSWGWYDQFMMDYLPLNSKELSFDRIESSIIWVTGKYSIKLPLLYGYCVAEKQPPKDIELFSDMLGALYQTGDDIIGLFGNERMTGKSNFGDITQGKKTLPMWFAYENSNRRDRQVLTAIVGNELASPIEIKEVRQIVQRSGSLDQTKQLMHSYGARCRDILRQMDTSVELNHFLSGFIDYIETRDR